MSMPKDSAWLFIPLTFASCSDNLACKSSSKADAFANNSFARKSSLAAWASMRAKSTSMASRSLALRRRKSSAEAFCMRRSAKNVATRAWHFLVSASASGDLESQVTALLGTVPATASSESRKRFKTLSYSLRGTKLEALVLAVLSSRSHRSTHACKSVTWRARASICGRSFMKLAIALLSAKLVVSVRLVRGKPVTGEDRRPSSNHRMMASRS
mmetsp:Transcript_28749/g.82269  ORF Transcript_28749/g.82269 Transcript_28749/m.82269 type:complete len:214 (+) Transcript_28749:1091-1732(+)